MKIFYCKSCDKTFEANGVKREEIHPVFGASWWYESTCVSCEGIAREIKDTLRPVNKNSDSNKATCETGKCPFVN